MDLIKTRSCRVQYRNAGFHKPNIHRLRQHNDLREARLKRDAADREKIRLKLTMCSPFSPDSALRNIVAGVFAEESVNVQCAWSNVKVSQIND